MSRSSHRLAEAVVVQEEPGFDVEEPEPTPKAYRRLLRQASSYASFELPKGLVETKTWYRTGRPVVCMMIMATCSIMLLVEFAVNDWEVEPFGTNPTLGPSVDTLIELGAKRTDLIVDQGHWFRLIAPMFLHGGILHFTFNMLGLWSIGFPLERQFGSLAMAYIFFLSGFMGVIMSAIFSPKIVGVGASGGIFGIFGAAWSELFQNWSLYQGQACKSLTQLIFATVFNMLLGLMPFLDNFAHLGGFFSGFVCGLGVLVSDRYTRFGELKERKTYQIVLQIISVVMTPIMVVIALFVLYFGIGSGQTAQDWCSWCKYLSCAPFPPNVPDEEKWWTCDVCSDAGVNATMDVDGRTTIQCPQDGPLITTSLPPETNLKEVLISLCRDLCLKGA